MTNNSNRTIDIKIELRKRALDMARNNRVLEAFAGDGVLWDAVQSKYGLTVQRTRVDRKKGYRGAYIVGDSLQVMRSIDVHSYGIVDLDDYGVPVTHLAHLIDIGYSGVVVITALLSGLSKPPRLLLSKLPPSWRDVFGSQRTITIRELIADYLHEHGLQRWQVYEYNNAHKYGQNGTRGIYALVDFSDRKPHNG